MFWPESCEKNLQKRSFLYAGREILKIAKYPLTIVRGSVKFPQI